MSIKISRISGRGDDVLLESETLSDDVIADAEGICREAAAKGSSFVLNCGTDSETMLDPTKVDEVLRGIEDATIERLHILYPMAGGATGVSL